MNDDVPPANPLAREIHKRFWRKMQPGGEIDQILNGGEPLPKQKPESDQEIDRRRRDIDIQMAEYEQEIVVSLAWYRQWKAGRRGFRAKRRNGES